MTFNDIVSYLKVKNANKKRSSNAESFFANAFDIGVSKHLSYLKSIR